MLILSPCHRHRIFEMRRTGVPDCALAVSFQRWHWIIGVRSMPIKKNDNARRRGLVALMSIVIPMVPPPAGTEERAMPPSSCESGHWSEPRPAIAGSGPVRSAQFLNVATGRSQSWIVGTDIPMFDGSPVRESPLTAAAIAGVDIGHPAGRWTFAMPTAVVDNEDQLHVLWAEPPGVHDTFDSGRWPPRQLTSIWAARYSPASGWSVPERIYEGENLFWTPGPIADGVLRGESVDANASRDDRIGLAVATFTGDPQQPLLLLRRRAARWSVDTIPSLILGGPVEASFGADRAGVYVAFLAPDAKARSDVNSVFFARSSDDGHSWGTARLISRSGSYPAHELQLLVASTGVVHLVWRQTGPDGSVTLRHAMSDDGGTRWGKIDDDGAPGQRKRLRAVMDACGRVHAVYEDWSRGPDIIRLAYVMWNGAWTRPEILFPGWSTQVGAITIAPHGGPRIVFQARPPAADPMSVYQLRYADLIP